MSRYTSEVGGQYDLFQTSLESIEKPRKFLNYGYTVSRKQSFEDRQERLCLEVFNAANIEKDHVLIDVGFGSGEQDFLLSKHFEFRQLIGFNVSKRQVQYATQRAEHENLSHKLSFRHGEAEQLAGIENASVDRILAVECAIYFDRPVFYRRAAAVLKPAGLLVLADISLSTGLANLTQKWEPFRRAGSLSGNQNEWEKYFHTRSLRDINGATWQGAQRTVFKILKVALFGSLPGAERREWLRMAFFSQLIALGLMTHFVNYDLIVLRKK